MAIHDILKINIHNSIVLGTVYLEIKISSKHVTVLSAVLRTRRRGSGEILGYLVQGPV